MIPAAREKVKIRGRNDEYFVLAVDRDLECAYVVESRGHGYVEMVRFNALMPATDANLQSQSDSSQNAMN